MRGPLDDVGCGDRTDFATHPVDEYTRECLAIDVAGSRPPRAFDVKSPVLCAALHHRVTAKRSAFDAQDHDDVGSHCHVAARTGTSGGELNGRIRPVGEIRAESANSARSLAVSP